MFLRDRSDIALCGEERRSECKAMIVRSITGGNDVSEHSERATDSSRCAWLSG